MSNEDKSLFEKMEKEFEENQAKKQEEQPAEEKPIESMVPPKEELVTMTKDQLEELKKSIVEETAKRLTESGDLTDKLRLTLERDSAITKVQERGEFANPSLKIVQSGDLTPVDHQEAVVAPHKTRSDLHYRVINRDNDTLYSLRRYQGYEPVKDDDGHEVRYMDGVLAAMPKRKYEETVKARVEANKMLRKQSSKNAAEDFVTVAQREGLKPIGDGVQIDVTKERKE